MASDDFARILIICTRQIGDVLMTTPVIALARQRWPRARIDFLGFSGSLSVLEGHPDLTDLIALAQGAGWSHSWPLIRRIWRRYDLAVVCEVSDRAHLCGWIASRHRAVQLPVEWPSAWWKRRIARHVSVQRWENHVVLERLGLLAPWADRPERIAVAPPPDVALPEALSKVLRPGYIVVQAPSLVRYKQWPVGHYVTLVGALVAQGHQVVLTGSGSERDKAVTAEVARCSRAPDVIDAAGLLDLSQVTGLLQRAALYIGPDTSITHLAAACGVPLVTLYGPSDPTLWGPWPQGAPSSQPYIARAGTQRVGRITVLQGTQPCVPCRQAGCDRHDESRSDCLETMAPDRVLLEAERLLALDRGVSE